MVHLPREQHYFLKQIDKVNTYYSDFLRILLSGFTKSVKIDGSNLFYSMKSTYQLACGNILLESMNKTKSMLVIPRVLAARLFINGSPSEKDVKHQSQHTLVRNL
uniref:Uncharacterized protein n=1 Tax=Rhodnius prolixus TaxID=13249 RepID=T1HL25_RHOPR